MLRCRLHFSIGELIQTYKTQVLSTIEAATPAIYHAPPFFLGAVDRVQDRLLEELELTSLDSLAHFNLAPLSSRRDMSMLGLIHRVVLGEALAN